MSAKDNRDGFLSRWSRLKQEARSDPAPESASGPGESPAMPELPPVDQLNFDSDFRAFMDKRVDEGLRRVALKKLFSDPRFNITDGLDDFAEDYSALEDLSKELVDGLQHARRVLRGAEDGETPRSDHAATQEPASEPAQEPPADQAATVPDAGAGRDAAGRAGEGEGGSDSGEGPGDPAERLG